MLGFSGLGLRSRVQTCCKKDASSLAGGISPPLGISGPADFQSGRDPILLGIRAFQHVGIILGWGQGKELSQGSSSLLFGRELAG